LNGIHLLDSGTGFVVGDTGTILKTTDLGATWAPLTSGTTRTLHDVYLFDPNQGVTVGDRGLILRTTDGGTNWQRVASGIGDSLRSVSFSGINGICGGDSQTILYSTDSGASWQIGQTGFFGGGFPGTQMLSATAGFVAGQNSIFQSLLGATTDGGSTWSFQAFYFDQNEGGATDVFFFDQNTGVVSGSVFDGRGAIARTTDGGVNWSTSFFDQPIEAIDFPQITSGFAVGWGGRTLRSTNMGITWIDQSSGTSANLSDVSFVSDALTGIAVGDSGTILRTTNGGEPSPTPTPTATPTPTVTPTPTPSQIVLRASVERFPHRELVHLRWTGAISATMNIFRNGVRLATVQNTGFYSDVLTVEGRYTYQVCEAATRNCSNEVTVRFGRPPL
jgi:photosystem II stability/assembly factor-like uncharacterized protein